MSITRKTHWMFAAAAAGALALTACSPAEAPATADAQAPADAAATADAATASPAQAGAPSVEALQGLTIVQFGPTSAKAGEAFNEQPDGSSAIWAKADRELSGYDAALWLNGVRLGHRAVSGATVSGAIPAELLAKPGTLALEIRIGENGTELTSSKVDFVVE